MNKKKERRLKNKISKTPKRTLKLKAKVLTNWVDKIKGLMGLTRIYPVYFETRLGIHTFGMKKPIDVFILDNKNRVIKIGKNITPNRMFFWNPKYSKVIETPINFLKANILDKIIIV